VLLYRAGLDYVKFNDYIRFIIIIIIIIIVLVVVVLSMIIRNGEI